MRSLRKRNWLAACLIPYYVVIPANFLYFNFSVVQLVATIENVVKCVEMVIARIDEVRKCLEIFFSSIVQRRFMMPL